MTKKYEQAGEVLDYTNSTGSDISAGDIVEMQNVVAVALEDIADTTTGSVKVTGVFRDMPKETGTAWVQGDELDWDMSVGVFGKGITPATGDITGCAIAAADADSADTTGKVLLARIPGTIN